MLLKDLIRSRMSEVLNSHNGLIFGHNLVNVGWVAETIPALPDHPNYIDLPITDIAGAGLAVGSALSGRPVVYISRYHGYLWLNLAPIATYAAPCKTAFQQDCWLMIRAIADDGAFGPVASGTLLGLAVQIRDLTVCAPSNSSEWEEVWEYFLKNKSPIFVSEHRNSYGVKNLNHANSYEHSIVVLSIGGTSALLPEIKKGLESANIDFSHYSVLWLKPLKFSDQVLSHLARAKHVFILDPGSKQYGVACGIVTELGLGSKAYILSASDFLPGYAKSLQSKVGDPAMIVHSILTVVDC